MLSDQHTSSSPASVLGATSRLASLSLCLGILCWVQPMWVVLVPFNWPGWWGDIAANVGLWSGFASAPAAMATGLFALRQIRTSEGRLVGKRRALVGLVLGCVMVILFVVFILPCLGVPDCGGVPIYEGDIINNI